MSRGKTGPKGPRQPKPERSAELPLPVVRTRPTVLVLSGGRDTHEAAEHQVALLAADRPTITVRMERASAELTARWPGRLSPAVEILVTSLLRSSCIPARNAADSPYCVTGRMALASLPLEQAESVAARLECLLVRNGLPIAKNGTVKGGG